VDLVRSYETSDLNVILLELRDIARAYGISLVLADRYGGGWVSEVLKGIGLETVIRPGLPVVYMNLRRLVNMGRIDLPDNEDLRSGLENTMAFYGRNNSVSISHERSSSGHADAADAVASVAWGAAVDEGEEVYEVIDLRERYAHLLVSTNMKM
jgi:hypothetical protein